MWTADAAATPFLLVHGLASNSLTWHAVADLLATAGHPVVAVDLRGHGASDRPERGYDFVTLGADLTAALAELGWSRPILVGQSMGANLVYELALSQPVAAVAGIDGGIIDLASRWPDWEECRSQLAPPVLDGITLDEIAGRLHQAHPHWTRSGVDATLANLEVTADGSVRARLQRPSHLALLRAMWEQRPYEVLASLDAPALLVLADGPDPTWSKSKRTGAHLAREAKPDLWVEWIVGEHDLHVGHPDAVAGLLVQLASTSLESANGDQGSPVTLSRPSPRRSTGERPC